MYFMSEHEIRWTNTLYPQYQLYEHRLSSFIDRSWPISLHQNEVTMANAGFSIQGMEISLFVRFVDFIFIGGYPMMSQLQNIKSLIEIVKLSLYFKMIINQQFNTTDCS